jgi:hypothetical protein
MYDANKLITICDIHEYININQVAIDAGGRSGDLNDLFTHILARTPSSVSVPKDLLQVQIAK